MTSADLLALDAMLGQLEDANLRSEGALQLLYLVASQESRFLNTDFQNSCSVGTGGALFAISRLIHLFGPRARYTIMYIVL